MMELVVIISIVGLVLALGAALGAMILVVRKLPPADHRIAETMGRNYLAAGERFYGRGVAAGQGRPQFGAWDLEGVPPQPEPRMAPSRPVDDTPVLIGKN